MLQLCRAVEFNKPVTKKIVTIDGDNVIRKGNYAIQNGVSFDNLIDFVGIPDKEAQMKIIDGSLLKGKAEYNMDISISLTTNTILLLEYNEYAETGEYNCISCGKCSQVCPMFLNPQRIEGAFLDGDTNELEKLKIKFMHRVWLLLLCVPIKKIFNTKNHRCKILWKD